MDKNWVKDTIIRLIRTVVQTMIGLIGSSVFITDVSWGQVLSASALAGIVSLLMSIDRYTESK